MGWHQTTAIFKLHFNFLKIFVIFIVQTETCAYLWEIVELFLRAEA